MLSFPLQLLACCTAHTTACRGGPRHKLRCENFSRTNAMVRRLHSPPHHIDTLDHIKVHKTCEKRCA